MSDDRATTDGEADERFMRRAIELAREGAAAGNSPYGAVRARVGEELAAAHNTVADDSDLSAHPELDLARWAWRELDAETRAATTMYASTMPCMMCSAGVAMAGLGRVVYGVDGETAGRYGPDRGVPTTDHLAAETDTVVDGPVLPEEAEAVHRDCW
jgi:tRNA(Arg) A34 adenosine deaminase TadA